MPVGVAPTLARLWLVREAGDPVALVTGADRAEAVRNGLIARPGAAVGEMSCAHVGHALPSAGAVVARFDRHTAADAAVPVTVARAPSGPRPRGRLPNERPSNLVDGTALAAAYRRGCAVAGLPEHVVRSARSRVATAVRHAMWGAMREYGMTLCDIGRMTGHDTSTVSSVLSSPTLYVAGPQAASSHLRRLADDVRVAMLQALREHDSPAC